MPDEKLIAQLLPDGETAELALGNTAFQMKSEQLEELIAALADLRSRMTPEVPLEFPHGVPTHFSESTAYHFAYDAASMLPVLAFRSPAFGWLSFELSRDDAAQLASDMQSAANHPLLQNMNTRN